MLQKLNCTIMAAISGGVNAIGAYHFAISSEPVLAAVCLGLGIFAGIMALVMIIKE